VSYFYIGNHRAPREHWDPLHRLNLQLQYWFLGFQGLLAWVSAPWKRVAK
jgi:hypothetical protein